MILVMQTIHFFIFFCDDIDQPSISITMGILVSAYTDTTVVFVWNSIYVWI